MQYYYDKDPLASFREEELRELHNKLEHAETIIAKNDLIIENQAKYIKELAEKIAFQHSLLIFIFVM